MGSLALSNAIVLALVLFGVLLVVLWIALPFAVFGVKALLRELIAEVHRTNTLLEHARQPFSDRHVK